MLTPIHLIKLTATTLLLASISLFTLPAQANLMQQQSTAIVRAFDGTDSSAS
ncbi:hypothetical protein ACIPZC_01710 [Pseudomonas sp. NPDC089743]|uniref:hypothetical protein n=1 Tax=Pseudomonas sp. NPDC089743 TaxID=3364471 RepID=UPI0037F318EC